MLAARQHVRFPALTWVLLNTALTGRMVPVAHKRFNEFKQWYAVINRKARGLKPPAVLSNMPPAAHFSQWLHRHSDDVIFSRRSAFTRILSEVWARDELRTSSDFRTFLYTPELFVQDHRTRGPSTVYYLASRSCVSGANQQTRLRLGETTLTPWHI